MSHSPDHDRLYSDRPNADRPSTELTSAELPVTEAEDRNARATGTRHKPHHHKARGYRNPPGSPLRIKRRNRLLKFLWRQRIHAFRPEVPPGHVLPREAAKAQLAASISAGTDSLTWLGHAACLLRLAGRTILIDPFLSDYASPVQGVGPKRFAPSGLAVEQLPPIDLLLVSHNHYDHLDIKTIESLPNKRQIQVVVPLGLGHYFRTHGFAHVRELDWHHGVDLGPLRVTVVPAIHRSARGILDRNRTLWAGFVLQSAERKVYFGGDTGYGAIFRDTGRRLGPFDLAILGIGCYAPRAAMHMNHANPEEAVQIARDLGAHRVMAMHWGTIIMTTEPPFEPPQWFRTAATAQGYGLDEAWVMAIGETRVL